jgi:hypothetical protein
VIAEFKKFDVDWLHRGFVTPAALERVLEDEGWVIMNCSLGQGASNGGKFVGFGGVLAEIWMFVFLRKITM